MVGDDEEGPVRVLLGRHLPVYSGLRQANEELCLVRWGVVLMTHECSSCVQEVAASIATWTPVSGSLGVLRRTCTSCIHPPSAMTRCGVWEKRLNGLLSFRRPPFRRSDGPSLILEGYVPLPRRFKGLPSLLPLCSFGGQTCSGHGFLAFPPLQQAQGGEASRALGSGLDQLADASSPAISSSSSSASFCRSSSSASCLHGPPHSARTFLLRAPPSFLLSLAIALPPLLSRLRPPGL